MISIRYKKVALTQLRGTKIWKCRYVVITGYQLTGDPHGTSAAFPQITNLAGSFSKSLQRGGVKTYLKNS